MHRAGQPGERGDQDLFRRGAALAHFFGGSRFCGIQIKSVITKNNHHGARSLFVDVIDDGRRRLVGNGLHALEHRQSGSTQFILDDIELEKFQASRPYPSGDPGSATARDQRRGVLLYGTALFESVGALA